MGVSCQTELLFIKSVLPSTDSMNLASRNLWQTERAISLAMEKVVVVVVVTTRDESLGSGMRLDWENLRDPRLVIASSDVKVWSIILKRTRWAVRGSETINVEKRSLKSLVKGRSSSVIRSKRELVWCILSFVSGLGLSGGRGGTWASSAMESSSRLARDEASRLERARECECEERGAPEGWKSEADEAAAEVEALEGVLLSSRLPFRSRGKRASV